MNYEQWDRIADSTIPTLAIVALVVPWLLRPFGPRRALIFNVLSLAAVAIAYAEQAVDNTFHFWPAMGLDFSGHTAVFLAIASSLWHQRVVWRWITGVVFVAYAALMLYQRYHTVADILTTAVVMIPVLWAYWLGVRRTGLRRALQPA